MSDVVREIKRASSVWVSREKNRGFSWQAGYGAFSVSRWELDALRTYIAGQEEHHHAVSSADELRALLLEHGVEYEEKYFE
ncbi:transposase [Fimbriimonas ginsengisoli Gsoil 348]|uniref:Transposase n=1 Tax=Fimbriimonas ginsengisoli Gsoil 348 TaxID=661478 RepID=A0A068NYV8_FIMGI|nr:transposase [Fimbriimonas ginsengisoli Gsoil 348]